MPGTDVHRADPGVAKREPSRAQRWLVYLMAGGSGALGFFLRPELGLPLLGLTPALCLVWAAFALGHHPAGRLGATLRRRLPLLLVWLLAGMAIIVALAAAPGWWLSRGGGLPAVLALSAAAALAWVAIWRIWPVWGIPLVDAPRARHTWPLLPRSLQGARQLVADDPKAGRGLLGALVILLLIAGGPMLGALAMDWTSGLRGAVALAWSALAAPLFAYVYMALIEPARLAARAATGWNPLAPAAIEAAPVAVAPAPPTLLPPDPDARLWAAARIGRIDEALAAIEQGADCRRLPAAEDRDQRALAVLASIHPDTRLLRKLIELGVDLNRAQGGLTPLLAATRDSLRGRPDTVMTLLANGADPRVADPEGRTPLHFAALSNEPDVAALLLDAGAPIDAINRDGFTPLGVACAHGNWRLARFLLERKARIEPPGAQSALLAAASGEDDPVGVQLLLRHRARVDHPSRLGRTALHAAALADHVEISRQLLEAGASPNTKDEAGITALLEAARAGANGILRLLAARKLDVTSSDRHGRNALVLASQSQRADAETIELLLGMGVDARQAAADGRSALDCAVAQGRWPMVRLLDPGFPLPASLLSGDQGPPDEAAALADDGRPWQARLDEAIAEQESWRVRAVLRLCAPPAEELFEFVLRHHSAFSVGIRQLLVQAIELDWLQHHDSVRRAARAGDSVLLEALLDRGASPSGGGLLAEFLATRSSTQADDETLALRMLGAGADAFGGAPAPILLASRLGMHELLRSLLRRGAWACSRDARGITALHQACLGRHPAAIALLLRHGAQPTTRAADGSTPLGLALALGRQDLVDWLDWRGWAFPPRAPRGTDLVAAAASGDVAAVDRLLALGMPVGARDHAGATALLRACGGGHLAVARCLLENGADPAAAADSGATCLSAAVSQRHRDIAECLLDAGVAVDQRLPGGVTALMVAAALGAPDMLSLLLARGANPELSDDAGNRPIHALAQFGFTAQERERVLACWQVLLNPASADVANADGLSPLLLLLGARADIGHPIDERCLAVQLELLLKHAVDLERRDVRGFGPLHLCALHGHLASLPSLLVAGASREARDALNRTPQDIAIMRGFVDLAADLAPHRAAPAPSIARFLKGPGG